MPQPNWAAATLGFLALTALLSSEYHRRIPVPAAKAVALLLLPVMVLWAGHAAATVAHPFAGGGWLSWPIAAVIFYLVARRHEGPPAGQTAKLLHVVSIWLLVALLSWELAWAIDTGVGGSPSWPTVAWALPAAVVLLALPRW